MTPDEIAAEPVTILKVDPVGVAAPMARLYSGRSLFSTYLSYLLAVIGVAKSFGSKFGYDAIASTPPLHGSSTTTAPDKCGSPFECVQACSPSYNALETICCSRKSIVVTTTLPGLDLRNFSSPMTAPQAFTTTCWPPAVPRRYLS